jgi:hypothetical protein
MEASSCARSRRPAAADLCGATDEGENRMNDDDTPVVHEPSLAAVV